jgi:hypothetical protein
MSARVYSMGPRGLGYVRHYYSVPARRRMRVIAEGLGPGVITGGAGAHIRVRLDGEKHSAPHHPLSLDYLDGVDPADRLWLVATRTCPVAELAGHGGTER